uniref:Protein kinase domain-containing protein n=1 Tax=Pristionchus pacificus TaxID=54126 RepID=A0A8R1Z9A5_PRIPA
MDQVIATADTTYILKTESRKDEGRGVEFYDVTRRSDEGKFRMEFDKCDVEGGTVPKRFELEATMRSIFHSLPKALPVHHLNLCTDLGAHCPWRFLIFPEEYISVGQFLSEIEKEDKTPQLSLRIALHSFLGIQMLHKVDIVHGNIRPENMYIGLHRSGRVVKIANFEHSTSLNKDIPKCTDLGNLVYASRGRMRNYEGTKKDDLESWMYCVAEFFHRDLIPWNPEIKDNKEDKENNENKEKKETSPMSLPGSPNYESDMLKLKRAFCKGGLWKAAREVLPQELGDIQKILMKTTGRAEPQYEQIWNRLNSANIYIEANVFGIATWTKANQGAPTTPSPHACNRVDNSVEDYDGKVQ